MCLIEKEFVWLKGKKGVKIKLKNGVFNRKRPVTCYGWREGTRGKIKIKVGVFDRKRTYSVLNIKFI